MVKDGKWVQDLLGPGFEMRWISHPDDYSGKVVSTVIRRANASSKRGILYVHGFSDYFLQKELADMFSDHGYSFYAVDLRKYGRSLLSGQKMFQVRDLHEYFPDIDIAAEIMVNDGIEEIVLLGHSTGGLISSLYMTETPPAVIKGLMLNSPFLAWNLSALMRRAVIPVVSALGRLFPGVRVHQKPDGGYAATLAKDLNGEWEYRRDWKPDIMPDPDMGWIRAIERGQHTLRPRKIRVPVLLMHSADSVRKNDSRKKYFEADAILDVRSISRYGRQLGDDVTEVSFEGALHDIALSRKRIREEFYDTMLNWMRERGL